MFPEKVLSEKKETPGVFVTQMSPEATETTSKGGLTKKHVLIAITTVLVTLLIVGGIVAVTHEMKERDVEFIKSFKFRDTNGKDNEETVNVNVKESTTEMKVTTEGEDDFSLLNDFKRGISVFKMTIDGEPRCAVTPMNKTATLSPETLEAYLETHPHPEMVDERSVSHVKYEMAEENIEDTDFLGFRINTMCEGHAIYWLYPKTEDEEMKNVTSQDGRKKRAAGWPADLCGATLLRKFGIVGGKYLCRKYTDLANTCRVDCCRDIYSKTVIEGGKVVVYWFGTQPCYIYTYYPCISCLY
ncbi:unnamed protein product [Owenia fusiformis]|uniref:Integral membrane protein 2 n=1 Tax=Owenia fusiformis TaxID=6347 RepID=A0A8J1TQV3_OWEFU|nr:unnamed protein product [Owenia fusiformis]